MTRINSLAVMTIVIFLAMFSCQENPNTLRVSKINPRYFTDNSGKAIYLTGSHTWNTLVEMNTKVHQDQFDFDTYLDFMNRYNHNFLRLWIWELFVHNDYADTVNGKLLRTGPFPWKEVDSEIAYDGNSKFDLNQFNTEFFNKLKKRVADAGAKNIYVSVMLFEGWGEQFLPHSFRQHPFHPMNNINNIHVDSTTDGRALAVHEMKDTKVLEIQKAYVKKVIETLNEFDHILYEISNENHPASTSWQYFMIDYIRECEQVLPKKHPVGMTFQYEGGKNQALLNNAADWISPNAEGGYKDSPRSSPGSKIIISDTDHLWGLGGNHQWVWKSFMQGINPIFMDPYDGELLDNPNDVASLTDEIELLRKSMGHTLYFAKKIDLISMNPDTTISSTGYCLAAVAQEYLVYAPTQHEFEVDLKSASGFFTSAWFDPVSGTTVEGEPVEGGDIRRLISPFKSGESVVYLKRQ
jgi:hypothetical protein